MDKYEFQQLYYSMSLKELAKVFNCSVPTIINTAKKYGIPLKRGNGKIRINKSENK